MTMLMRTALASEAPAQATALTTTKKKNSGERMLSLDAFRGFTIASMILVNNPGDWNHIYKQLGHAKWNGWTFTDWVFPFFLFIGGLASTLSLGKRAKEPGADKSVLLRGLAKRALLIFLIGILLNLIPSFDFAHVRVMGVLQRIAITTLIAAPIVVYFDWKKQAAAIVVCFALYAILMLGIPVPDAEGANVARGVLEPGRDFGAYVDRAVFGSKHLWVTSKTWDPEGLVSTLPAVGSQLFGVLTGQWIARADRTAKQKALGLVIAGVACALIGELLGAVFMPINKSLWTPSYAVAMTGWALLVFSFFYFVMDVKKSETAKKVLLPLNIYGMNALFIFAVSVLVAKMTIRIKIHNASGTLQSLKGIAYAKLQALPLGDPKINSLVFAIAFDLLMLAIAWGMWKKKWFVKV
jgi:predicted acyltransferase